MEGILICNRGIEDLACLEIREILGSETKTLPGEGYSFFHAKDIRDVCTMAYASQLLSESTTFKVEAQSAEENLHDIEESVGAVLHDTWHSAVNLENPSRVIYLFIASDHAFLCVDFSGEDLSKRSYRIFSSPKNIKSTIAYAIVRYSGYERGEALLDPFCISGSIAIEAALYENSFPVRFFDKKFLFSNLTEFDYDPFDAKRQTDNGRIFAFDSLFKHVDAAKKNAKIAGIHKAIQFSRMDVEWLDTKFDMRTIRRFSRSTMSSSIRLNSF